MSLEIDYCLGLFFWETSVFWLEYTHLTRISTVLLGHAYSWFADGVKFRSHAKTNLILSIQLLVISFPCCRRFLHRLCEGSCQ